MKTKVTVEDMRALCAPCADKMVAEGVAFFWADSAQADLGQPSLSPETVAAVRAFADAKPVAGATQDINGVEVFAAGKWNGDDYTVNDLKSIVEAFNETGDLLKPYLKLGHGDRQGLLAADEMPAAGWVKNLRLVGTKLLADFKDIPNKVAELIKRRAYARVSSEIFVNIAVNGKKYPYALKAVALLGGETPAVQTLDDVHALYALDSTVLAYTKEAEVRAYNMDPAHDGQEAPMPEPTPAPAPAAAPETKDHAFRPPMGGGAPQPPMGGQPQGGGDECFRQLQQAHAQLQRLQGQMGGMMPHTEHEAKVKEFADKVTALTAERDAEKARADSAEGEVKKYKMEKAEAEVGALIATYVQEKKVLPAQAGILKTILLQARETGVKKFKVGEKEFDSAEALIKEFVSLSGEKGLPTDPKSEAGAAHKVLDVKDGEAMDKAVREFMTKTGEKSYSKAYTIVAAKAAEAEAPATPTEDKPAA